MDDGRTLKHGYTISSPCEPDGSVELKKNTFLTKNNNVFNNVVSTYLTS